jgi:hypothetical protein
MPAGVHGGGTNEVGSTSPAAATAEGDGSTEAGSSAATTAASESGSDDAGPPAVEPPRRRRRSRLRCERDEDAERELLQIAAARRALEEREAVLLLRVQRKGHHRTHGCHGIGEYGERVLRMPARIARARVALAKALEAFPDVAEAFRTGASHGDHVATLMRLFAADAKACADRTSWLEHARVDTARQLSRRVTQHLAEQKIEEKPQEFTLYLPRGVVSQFIRARVLYRRRRRGSGEVTDAEVFAAILDDWLKQNDWLRRRAGRRRLPHTRFLRGKRYVPWEVRRALAQRYGGERCAIDGCDNEIWLDKTHEGVPHAEGGSREEEDLGSKCTGHHHLDQEGLISVERRDDEIVYVDMHGRRIGRWRKIA